MISAIKAEFRKLLTIRSTYVLALLCLAVTVLISFYIHGIRAEHIFPEGAPIPPTLLDQSTRTAINAISLFVGILGVLVVTHEYRYNVIMYSLMAARRRWYVPAAKIIAVSTFAVIVGAAIALLAPLLTHMGLNLAHVTIPAQDFDQTQLLLKGIFYTWASAMFGLIIALLVRSQVGAIVTLLLFPGLIENLLLKLILKDNTKYLPFTALDQFLSTSSGPGAIGSPLSVGHAALVVVGYIVVGSAVAFVLFQKRDAN